MRTTINNENTSSVETFTNAGGVKTEEDVWIENQMDSEEYSPEIHEDTGVLVSANIKEDLTTERLPMERLEGSKLVKTCVTGVIFSFVLVLSVLLVYTGLVKYPNELKVDEKSTGIYCINQWVSSLKSIESLGTESYLAKEIVYANGSELKANFCKRVLETIKYTPKEANKKNIYGNDFIDKSTNSTVKELSYVSEGEEILFSYIDYDSISIDESVLENILTKYNLKLGDVDYENKLADVFCEYILNIPIENIPTKSISRVPEIVKDGNSYRMLTEEDIYIDKLLFSSKEFDNLRTRFSEVAAKVSSGEELSPTQDWSNWNSLSEEQKELTSEPSKYDSKQVMNTLWCGAYYLQNEYELKDSQGNVIKKGVSANIGDGTKGNPAGLDTGIITYVLTSEKDKESKETLNKYPIRVTLRDYKVSEEAIEWFESKDIRNRGIDVTSEVQYCAYTIEVTNLSDRKLVIEDNSCLCDQNANMFPKSGEMFGLVNSLTLEPYQSGVIESWGKSTELNRKYLIWGKNFDRKLEPVWFRILMGNLEDDSEDKGVNINKSRSGENTSTELDSSSEVIPTETVVK